MAVDLGFFVAMLALRRLLGAPLAAGLASSVAVASVGRRAVPIVTAASVLLALLELDALGLGHFGRDGRLRRKLDVGNGMEGSSREKRPAWRVMALEDNRRRKFGYTTGGLILSLTTCSTGTTACKVTPSHPMFPTQGSCGTWFS